jgi:hypothetical protein
MADLPGLNPLTYLHNSTNIPPFYFKVRSDLSVSRKVVPLSRLSLQFEPPYNAATASQGIVFGIDIHLVQHPDYVPSSQGVHSGLLSLCDLRAVTSRTFYIIYEADLFN